LPNDGPYEHRQGSADGAIVNLSELTRALGYMRRTPPIAFEASNNGDDRPHRVEAFEPDMAAHCDGVEAEEPVENTDLAIASAVLNDILVYVIGERTVHLDLASAFRRFTALIWILRPEFVHHQSLAQLACELGVTRQALSKAALKFSDRHRLRNRMQKSFEAREEYSRAQRENHWRRRGKPEGKDSGQASGRPTPAL